MTVGRSSPSRSTATTELVVPRSIPTAALAAAAAITAARSEAVCCCWCFVVVDVLLLLLWRQHGCCCCRLGVRLLWCWRDDELRLAAECILCGVCGVSVWQRVGLSDGWATRMWAHTTVQSTGNSDTPRFCNSRSGFRRKTRADKFMLVICLSSDCGL